MPLSAPVKRTHIHTRTIHFTGYERDDGLFDIEAHMTDTKTYEFSNNWRNRIQPGEALHEMLLRVTIDDSFVIHEIEAVTDNSPFAICPEIAPAYQQLKGLKMAAGWRQAVRTRVGGVQGCTHLTELLYPMATVAIQTIKPLQNHRRKLADSDGSASPGRPFVLNTCHAWAEDSEVVKVNAPDWYRPPAAG
ncbi:MAG: DUF2889 domain-containing protein [Pseudomonadales bacterium]|nr:DUF2889 domain-containing protein [Pseudomonadales bacterium]